jgi:hypothetical protein
LFVQGKEDKSWMKPDKACQRAIHGMLNIHALSKEFLMSETSSTPESEYLHATPEHVASLADKRWSKEAGALRKGKRAC